MLVRLRISLPDRPGSLGRVATAIGTAGADIARIEVLAAEAGQAVDDVFVEVTDRAHLDRVQFTVGRLAGVKVLGSQHPVPPVSGHAELELVERLLAQPARAQQTLVDGAPPALGADWSALVAWGADGQAEAVLATSPGCPDADAALLTAPLRLMPVRLARHDGGGENGGAALIPLGDQRLGLLLVREEGPEFHPSELWRLGQLGDLCGTVLRHQPLPVNPAELAV